MHNITARDCTERWDQADGKRPVGYSTVFLRPVKSEQAHAVSEVLSK